MDELVKLWEEYEQFEAENQEYPELTTPTFARFIGWYRDIRPLKSDFLEENY